MKRKGKVCKSRYCKSHLWWNKVIAHIYTTAVLVFIVFLCFGIFFVYCRCFSKSLEVCNMCSQLNHFQRESSNVYGDRGGTVVKVLCYKSEGSIPAGVTGFFIDIKSFRSHYGPGVDSASNRNEYREYFLGVKAAGA